METGMLNSLHNEEEQFAIGGRSASHDSESPQWSGDTVGNGSQLSPQSEEGTDEDFDRTLSDWRRHVASLPMSDSEDYIVDEVNDVLNDTPSLCKAEKFSFSPDSLPENIVRSKNSIHMGKVMGDNRMMDNDNTSPKGNFYATINSVVYELDSDPNEKYIAYHGNSELDHDFISGAIQVISVDPDTLNISDTSSEGSMESSCCSSPYNNYLSEKSDCEDDGDDLVCEQDAVCVEDDEHNEIQYVEEDVICVSEVPQTPPRENSSRSSMLKEKCSPSSESSIDSPVAHVETPIERRTATRNSYNITPLPVLTNFDITPETTFSRHQKLKSISLPQSPSHCVDSSVQDLQTCMTFEDLKLIDFDRMFHISPSKVFNKHFNMPDPFDEHVSPFPETVSFDPIVDIKSKRDPECTLKSINNSQLDESKTTNDIIGIIDKDGMLDKVMNSSDLLFNQEDLKHEDDLDNPENFDLTSFITGEGDGEPSHLLNENFISSPYTIKSELKEEGRRHYGQSINKYEIDMAEMSNVIMSTPKRNKNMLSKVTSEMTMINRDASWPPSPKKVVEHIAPVKTLTKLKINLTNYPREPLVMRITKSESSRTPKEDSEDYIDVETVSDGESFPVLAANNLDSLLEQFEATEKISKRVNSLNGSPEDVVKMEPAPKHYSADDWEAKTEQFSTAWSQPLKPPQHKKLGSGRSPERKHYGSLTEMANIVSPCLSKSTHSTSSESVQLDHDYCSPIRRVSTHLRTVSSSTEGDSESLRSFSEDSFISPKPSTITAFYKQINTNSNRMLGVGKGKNIAMCMEHRTDEFKTIDSPDSVHSLLIKTPKTAMSTESLLKVIDASIAPCHC